MTKDEFTFLLLLGSSSNYTKRFNGRISYIGKHSLVIGVCYNHCVGEAQYFSILIMDFSGSNLESFKKCFKFIEPSQSENTSFFIFIKNLNISQF